jgi:maltooligosyltrehalose trehalohydrolase
VSRFEVWAPGAERVDLVVEDERRPMERAAADSESGAAGQGWWLLDAPDLGEGTDYAYSVDGGPARPDPRSPWQPSGVHGPSRVVDLNRMDGVTSGWQGFHLPSAVLYELHVGTFSPEGTFDGAIARLDHLADLGVGAVSLMPVNAFPGRHGWGYDGVALYAVHEPYGGPEGLARFVRACHDRGLGVILDVVYNHVGPSGNYLGEFGPYFTDRYATPWGEAVNLDGPGSDGVRRFILDNALMWLRDYDVDGLRLDAVHAILDTSAVHLLEEMAAEVEALAVGVGRPLWLIAESDLNDPRLLWSRERGGYGLHAQWSDDFHHALHAALTGEEEGYYADFGRLEDLAMALRHAYVYAGRHSAHRDRRHGRPATGLEAYRFLGYAQNHDQVGNRAQGERLGHLVGPDLAKVAAALVLTAPFVPMLFQGEEWMASAPFQYFTDHDDPALGEAVREGRRSEFASFGWDPESIPDPQDPETYRRSMLRWEEREGTPHAGVEAWYRELLALRRSVPDLAAGDLAGIEVELDEEQRTLWVRRGDVLICCNLSTEERGVAAGASAGVAEILLASRDGIRLDGDRVHLPGPSVAVLTVTAPRPTAAHRRGPPRTPRA